MQNLKARYVKMKWVIGCHRFVCVCVCVYVCVVRACVFTCRTYAHIKTCQGIT
jgi:hypothetical protein